MAVAAPAINYAVVCRVIKAAEEERDGSVGNKWHVGYHKIHLRKSNYEMTCRGWQKFA